MFSLHWFTWGKTHSRCSFTIFNPVWLCLLSLVLSWMHPWSVPAHAMEKWVFSQIRVDPAEPKIKRRRRWQGGRGEGQVQRGTAHFNGSLSTKWSMPAVKPVAQQYGIWSCSKCRGDLALAGKGAWGLRSVPGFWIPFTGLESKAMLSHFL